MCLSFLDHFTMPSHCIWNKIHRPYKVCKYQLLLTGSCLPRHLLSHYSFLRRHCGQTGLPSFPCVTKHFPCSLYWLLLTLHPSVQVQPLTNFPDCARAGFPSHLYMFPLKNWSKSELILFISFTRLSSAQPPFLALFPLSTHKLIQSPLRVETLIIYWSLNP